QIPPRDRARLRSLGVDVHRRNPDHLAGLHAGVALDPSTVDANLPGAQKLLQRAEAKARIVNLEPAVEAHARFVRVDRDMLDACHECLFRSGKRNAARAPSGAGFTAFAALRTTTLRNRAQKS